MNNNITKCLPAAWLLLALTQSGTVRAGDNDAFSLVTSASWQYLDNVLYLPDGDKPTFFGPDAPRADYSYSASVGLSFDKRIGRQQLSANASQNMTRYNDLNQLDNDGHNASANWKWELGNDLSGQLRYTNRRYMQGFADFRTTSPTKNLVTSETWRFDGAYKIDAFWALFGALSRDGFQNSVASRRGNDYDIDRFEAGARYTTRGGTAFELLGRRSEGDYPNRLPSFNATNSFSQKDIEARVRWQLLGHSKVSASLGQSERKHDNLPERDYEDVYGRVTWDWAPNGHINVNLFAERQISALDDLVSSYFRTTTYAIAPTWQYSGKLRFDGRVQWVSRDGSGQTVLSLLTPTQQLQLFGVVLSGPRQEDIRTYSLGATWLLQHNFSANAELRHDQRDSNNEFYQYDVNSVSMSLQYVF